MVFDVNDATSKTIEALDRCRLEFLLQSVQTLITSLSLYWVTMHSLTYFSKVESERVRTWCHHLGDIPFFEVSAKTSTNIELVFHTIAKNISKDQ